MENNFSRTVAEQANLGAIFTQVGVTPEQFIAAAEVAPNADSKPVADVIPFTPAVPDVFPPAPVDQKMLMTEFRAAILDLWRAGLKNDPEESKYRAKANAVAVSGLATILGVFLKYFHNKPIEQTTLLHNELKAQNKGTNKSSTVFHLLSRKYRRDDTKQASSDANILRKAYQNGCNETTFSAWVTKCGGLDKIKKGVQEHLTSEKKKALVTPKALYKRARDAMDAVGKASQGKVLFQLDTETMPEAFDVLLPTGKEGWKMVAVALIADKLVFLELTDHVPETEAADADDHGGKVAEVSEDDWDLAAEKQKAKIAADASGDVSESVEDALI